MLFSNLLIAIAVTTLWPLGLLGVLAACAWLERRTLLPEEIVPRRIRQMESKPPEAVEAMVLEETAQVVAAYWSSTGRPLPAGGASETNGRPSDDETNGRPSDDLDAARPVPVQQRQLHGGLWPADAWRPPEPDQPAQATPSPAAPGQPVPAVEAQAQRAVPGRAARSAMRRKPTRGRHERR